MDEMNKAEYQGQKVTLDKPFRLPSGSSKKFGVYVKDGDKVKRVTFGDPNMKIRRDDDKARANFRARHNCSEQKDKTSAAYWSCRMWEADRSVSDITKSAFSGDIFRVDEEERMVWGWASVAKMNDQYIVDRHGDVITPEVLAKAATSFMENVRVAKTQHMGPQIGSIVHSLPITKEIASALGIETNKEGWVIGMKIYDDQVWADVKKGLLPSFSFGGRGKKAEIKS